MTRKPSSTTESTANLGFEATASGCGGNFFHLESRSEEETGEVKWAWRQRPFGLAMRARRVRLRRQQPKQSNPTTRRLAIMNLAIRGIEADFGHENADTFRRDLYPDLRAA